jgi:hypothetical protein
LVWIAALSSILVKTHSTLGRTRFRIDILFVWTSAIAMALIIILVVVRTTSLGIVTCIH